MLTPAQERSLKALSGRARSAAIANYRKQNGNGQSKAQPKPAQKKMNAQPKRKPGPRPNGPRGITFAGTVACIDATNQMHIPPPMPMGPYTVMRGRFTQNFTTKPNDHVALLIGPHCVSRTAASTHDLTPNITPCIMIYGDGAVVPGTNDYVADDPVLSKYATSDAQAMAQLHAITVTVNCSSSAVNAQGTVYAGTLNQRIRRTSYATYEALSLALISRPEVKSYNAIGATGLKFSNYPVDVGDWMSQDYFIPDDASKQHMISKDTLGQQVVVFGPIAGVNYNVTIHTEWRVNFTEVALASTARLRPPASQGMWNNAIAAGNMTSGMLDTVTNVLQSGARVAHTGAVIAGWANATAGTLAHAALPAIGLS